MRVTALVAFVFLGCGSATGTGTGTCSTLSDCCGSVKEAATVTSCKGTAKINEQGACTTMIANLQKLGYCGGTAPATGSDAMTPTGGDTTTGGGSDTKTSGGSDTTASGGDTTTGGGDTKISGGAFTCDHPEKMAQMANTYGSGACGPCLKSNCDADLTAAFGAGWSAGDMTGGACGRSMFFCLCKCGDTQDAAAKPCFDECIPKEAAGGAACNAPMSAAGMCLQTKCIMANACK